MHFANPWFLLLLLPWAAEIVLREMGRLRSTIRLVFPDTRILRTLPTTWRVRYRRTPAVLLDAALVAAIIALARPQSVLKGEESRAKGIDIMMVMDTSGSMKALDFNPLDRMAAAKKAARNFVMQRQHDRIGLVVFGGVSFMTTPLTLDYAALLEWLDQVEVGMTNTENTAIGNGIATASTHLKRSPAKSKVIILVTDGRSNAGEIDAITAAKAAQALGIKIYTIGVGIRGPSVIPIDHPVWGRQMVPIQEDLDEPSLRDIAGLTGGQYYRATSAKELDQIYSEIDRLEKSDVSGPTPASYKDRYLGWLMTAMIALSLSLFLRVTVWQTLP